MRNAAAGKGILILGGVGKSRGSDRSVPTGLGEGLIRGFQSLYVHLPGGHQRAHPKAVPIIPRHG